MAAGVYKVGIYVHFMIYKLKSTRIVLTTSETQQVILFFVLAFVIGWLAFLPILLYHVYPKSSAFIFLFSPTLAALITAALTSGVAGVKEVLGVISCGNPISSAIC